MKNFTIQFLIVAALSASLLMFAVYLIITSTTFSKIYFPAYIQLQQINTGIRLGNPAA